MEILAVLGILLAILVVLIILFVIFSESPEKYYRKAAKCHKLGELYHEDGDEGFAQDCYKEAELYREKAEKLVSWKWSGTMN